MSLAQTCKTLEDERNALAAVNAEAAKEIEALKAALATAEKSATDVRAAAESAIAAAAEKAAVEVANLKQELAAAAQANADLQSQLSAATARADSAERKLRDPAFEHASAPGQKPVPDRPGETVSDEAFLKAYEAETDSAKRATMWRARFEKV